MSTPRLSYEEFVQRAPAAFAALRAMTKSVDDSGLEKALTELVKVRASQINGCAFCLSLHIDWARAAGVSQRKLDLVAAWREAPAFSDRERAALGWTEALTDLAVEPEIAAAYSDALVEFTVDEAAHLTVAVGLINQWNRIAIGFGFPPKSD